jgi:hypothetical protein
MAMAIFIPSIYNFCSWNAMELNFQGQKIEHLFYFYPDKILLQGEYEKVVEYQKKACAL